MQHIFVSLVCDKNFNRTNCEISEFIADVFKNWDMETRIRHLIRERSKNTTIHEEKILKICHDEKVGWGQYHRPLRSKVWEVIALFVLW
jgi:hypothetical protein